MYWMMEVGSPDSASLALIGKQPDLNDVLGIFSWYGGSKIEAVLPEKLEFYLSTSGGDYIPDFFMPEIPLMSKKMLDALKKAGVDNIDQYSAIIYDENGNLIGNDYFAINIIGRVSCADLDKSDCEIDDPNNLVGIDFDSLVIDEDRAHGHNLFRLHESVDGVVVSESVKNVLEKEGLAGVYFVKPEDWSS